MGRAWTAEVELALLEERWPEFPPARAQEHSTTFLTSVYQEYFSKLYPEVVVPKDADEKKIFFTTLKPGPDGEEQQISVHARKKVSLAIIEAASRRTHITDSLTCPCIANILVVLESREQP